MAQSLIIVPPLAPVAIVGDQSLSRMLTPDPKEAVFIPAGGASITLDFGSNVTIDTAFAGYHSSTSAWSVGNNSGNPNDGIAVTITGAGVAMKAPGYGPPYHAFRRGAPLTARYWQAQFIGQPGGYYIGTFALGLAFQPQWGTEWGSGALIEDTGSAERLFGGGFGIDEGVAASGYQWTFGDLQPTELRQLLQIVKDRRTTRSVLVVEDPDQTEGLNERIHWGLFRKLDAYERLDPLNTKWSLQIGDWA